ncbi:MAG: hypothetical protein U5K69_19950 [Balneolaceae bacterium]|nr:hypothetical protein [Balneolaceae bacterium]
MRKNSMYAIITGDIVESSKIAGKEKKKLFKALQEGFSWIQTNSPSHDKEQNSSFELFRGDSFQGAIPAPLFALPASLAIRSILRKSQPESSSTSWDARIAIGIGTIEYLPRDVSSGDGEAYRRSGRLLDAMKGEERLLIETPWPHVNEELNTQAALLDAIIAKWSPPQAETVLKLIEDKSRKTIADEFGISQAAVHYRVKGAGWHAIKKFLERYKTLITENIQSDN